MADSAQRRAAAGLALWLTFCFDLGIPFYGGL